MVSYSAKLDSRTKQHTQFGVSVSNGSRDMARTKVAEKKRKKKKKKRKKNEYGQNYIASPTGIANNNNNCEKSFFSLIVYRWILLLLVQIKQGGIFTSFYYQK